MGRRSADLQGFGRCKPGAPQAGVQRPLQQAGGDRFGGRRLLARGGGIDSTGSLWGLVGEGRRPEVQAQRPVQPVRAFLVGPQAGALGVGLWAKMRGPVPSRSSHALAVPRGAWLARGAGWRCRRSAHHGRGERWQDHRIP